MFIWPKEAVFCASDNFTIFPRVVVREGGGGLLKNRLQGIDLKVKVK